MTKTYRENITLQKVIFFIAILLFIVKTAAWFITGSLSILTDALESIANIIGGGVGLYSVYISSKPKDFDHPYGHGKAEFISAALEGTLIITAGIFIIYKAVESFFIERNIGKLDSGIILLGFTSVINFMLGYIAVRKGKANQSLQLVAGGKHLLSDTYSTIAVIVGLLIINYTGLLFLDSIIACIISIIIILTGYKIVRTSIAGIMDEADTRLIESIVALLNENRRENWIDLHNLRFIKYGSTLHCDCHVTLPWYLNVNEAHAEIEALASLIRNAFGESVEFFIHSDGCMDFSCNICFKHNCMVRKHEFKKKITWTIENVRLDKKHSLES